MTRGTAIIALLLLTAGLGRPARLDAHRLDEYLQAARIAIEKDRVTIELDLTPGVAVATSVLAAIDRDRDGAISDEEGERYARVVVDGLVLHVDGRRVPLALGARTVPAARDLTEGTGVLRLQASAELPAVSSGRHALFFRNVHRADVGVYLVNALVPADDRIEITRQHRDWLQHEATIEFQVGRSARPHEQLWSALAGLLVAGAVAALSVRRRHPVSKPQVG